MSYSRESVIEAYQHLGSIKGVCAETGAPPYNVYLWLRMAKLLKPADKQNYGTPASRLGGKAEDEFQRLVPFAMSTNKHLQMNCPSFDFDIYGITVDVKSCMKRKGTAQYVAATAAREGKELHPDFYAIFLWGVDKDREYSLLLIPDDLTEGLHNIYIDAKKEARWWQFEIAPNQLAEFFKCAKEAV